MTSVPSSVSSLELAAAQARYALVCDRIALAAQRAGRTPDAIRLVGVAKRQPRERVLAAIQSGVSILGQSYIQEARAARPEIESALAAWPVDAADENDAGGDLAPSPIKLEWRMVGRLQRNKARLAARLFDAVESVDRIELATALSRHAETEGRDLEVLLQVSLCGEPQKGGCEASDLMALAEAVMELPRLRLGGLMTVPSASPDAEDARPAFAALRELREKLGGLGSELGESELSMGMSGDLEVAIEEGATLIRVGTAVFGERVTPSA